MSDQPTPDLKERLRQMAQPLVNSLDQKMREQIDSRVDDRLEDRLRVIERAIADLDRRLGELEATD